RSRNRSNSVCTASRAAAWSWRNASWVAVRSPGPAWPTRTRAGVRARKPCSSDSRSTPSWPDFCREEELIGFTFEYPAGSKTRLRACGLQQIAHGLQQTLPRVFEQSRLAITKDTVLF